MKKIIILSTAILALSSGYAIAEDSDVSPQRGEKYMQSKIDTNGDGVVSEEEFLAHAKERFSKIDKDGSGDISKDERKSAHKHMREKKKDFKEKREERRSERKSDSQ